MPHTPTLLLPGLTSEENFVRVAPLSTRVPVCVALPVARVAVRRVRDPRTVRTAGAPAPLAAWGGPKDSGLRKANF